MRLSIWVMLPTVLFMSAFIAGTMYYAVRVYRRRPVSGAPALIGVEGTALDGLEPGSGGKVFVNGEYWNAVSDAPVAKGERVIVVEVKGLVLLVKKV
jgi:membrane-bound serine protease (ClpP class)